MFFLKQLLFPKADASGFRSSGLTVKGRKQTERVKLTENRLAALIKTERVLKTEKDLGLMDKVSGDSFIKHCQDSDIAPFPSKEGDLCEFLKGYCSWQAPTFGKNFLGSDASMQHVLEAKIKPCFQRPCVRSGQSHVLVKAEVTAEATSDGSTCQGSRRTLVRRGDASSQQPVCCGVFSFCLVCPNKVQ